MLKESFRPRIFLNAQLFLSGYRYRPHVSVEQGIWIRNFLNLLSREEIFESAMNPEIVWTLNPDILLSTDVTRASPVLYREYSRRSEQRKISGYVWTGKFAAWFESGYVWTWRFSNPERKSCGLKNIRIRVDGPLHGPRIRLQVRNIFVLGRNRKYMVKYAQTMSTRLLRRMVRLKANWCSMAHNIGRLIRSTDISAQFNL